MAAGFRGHLGFGFLIGRSVGCRVNPGSLDFRIDVSPTIEFQITTSPALDFDIRLNFETGC